MIGMKMVSRSNGSHIHVSFNPENSLVCMLNGTILETSLLGREGVEWIGVGLVSLSCTSAHTITIFLLSAGQKNMAANQVCVV